MARVSARRICESWLTILQRPANEHPDAMVLAHPECGPEVRAVADKLLSTGQMLDFAGKSDKKEFIIATEHGIVHSLKKRYPDKQFYPVSDKAVCPNMKKITLEKVLWSLEDMKYVITVQPDIRDRAMSGAGSNAGSFAGK